MLSDVGAAEAELLGECVGRTFRFAPCYDRPRVVSAVEQGGEVVQVRHGTGRCIECVGDALGSGTSHRSSLRERGRGWSR